MRRVTRPVQAVAHARAPKTSAGTYLEACIVADMNREPVVSRRLDDLLEAAGLVVVPVTAQHAEIASDAYRDFGGASGHPAGLNFGDCFAYALARATGEPLLLKGDDFVDTDVSVAPIPPADPPTLTPKDPVVP